MVRKRPGGVIDLSDSSDSDIGGSEDVQCSQLPFTDYDSYASLSETQVVRLTSYLFFTLVFFPIVCLILV